MGRSRNYVVLLTVIALAISACGGGETEGEDTTTVPSTSAVDDVTTTQAMVTTTTTAVTTTTTAAFDLESLDEVTLNSVNWNCAWAKDKTNPNTNAPFLMDEQFRNIILVGEAIGPFLDATADIDVANDDELKQAIGQACDEIGAPTEAFLDSF